MGGIVRLAILVVGHLQSIDLLADPPLREQENDAVACRISCRSGVTEVFDQITPWT